MQPERDIPGFRPSPPAGNCSTLLREGAHLLIDECQQSLTNEAPNQCQLSRFVERTWQVPRTESLVSHHKPDLRLRVSWQGDDLPVECQCKPFVAIDPTDNSCAPADDGRKIDLLRVFQIEQMPVQVGLSCAQGYALRFIEDPVGVVGGTRRFLMSERVVPLRWPERSYRARSRSEGTAGVLDPP